MILVDSSVWIDFFSASARPAGLELGRLIRDSAPVVLSGIVVTEVLQGLTRDYDQVEHYLSMWDILEPGGFTTYCQAAAIFRAGRSKGISLSKIDRKAAMITVPL